MRSVSLLATCVSLVLLQACEGIDRAATENGAFVDPVPSSSEVPRVRVPKIVGLRLGPAKHQVRMVNLKVRVRKRRSAKPAGAILAQSPAASAGVREGRLITVVVAVHRPDGAGSATEEWVRIGTFADPTP